MELYEFQKETVRELLNGKHIAVLGTGFGKTAIAMRWLDAMITKTRKRHVLVITTATKSRSGDMQQEATMWNGDNWLDLLDSFEVISWHKLKEWTEKHKNTMKNYLIVADEIQKIKGYTTGMGASFRKIALATSDWAGFTATPGDKWIDIMPYFVATKLVRNKTDFQRHYCVMQTFKGYPEITSYLREDHLIAMWKQISVIPDTTAAARELPSVNKKTVSFKIGNDYKKVLKTRVRLDDGELLDTAMGMCHYLRQLCFTKEKKQWLKDFIENLGNNCVFFCNYIEEENVVCEIAEKALPDGARIWRIDGKHHEIPTPETIGKYDIVVAHYASGGEALNLQFMHYWCAISPNYSFSMMTQAEGRIKRIGQKRPMFFYYLKTTGAIEEAIYNCLDEKHDFSELVWTNENSISDLT